MPYRYTKKDMAKATARLAKAMGKNFGDPWYKDKKTGKLKSKVGVWRIDYNPVYGGAVIEETVNEAGAVKRPFGDMRRRPRDFVETINFAIKTMGR